MFAQKATQQSLRRLAAGQPSMMSQFAVKKVLVPAAIGASVQTRPVATQNVTDEAPNAILAAQRKRRPNSPHFTIYQPQIPWILSITHRLTGASLSGGLYVFGTAYLVAPLFGFALDSASMAAAFASWPVLLKAATKFTLALPFTFHSLNGLRHLVWDFGKAFSIPATIKTGWTTVGLSVVSALALATLI